MRPQILFPLFADISTLPGIGPKLAKTIGGLAGPHVVDLLWHLPSGLVDRRFAPKIADAPPGRVATLEVIIGRHKAPPPGRRCEAPALHGFPSASRLRRRRPSAAAAQDGAGEDDGGAGSRFCGDLAAIAALLVWICRPERG